MTTKFQLKTKYYFGKECLDFLEQEIMILGAKNILFLYGKNSIKTNGIYQKITSILKKIKKVNFYEFSGIEPNPRDKTIDMAVKLCKKKKVDLILAIGGGSVIDASKVIGVVSRNNNIKKTWDYVLNWTLAKNPSIPIFSVLTLAGTGSENNGGSVITNQEIEAKVNVFNETAIPQVAFLNPEFTNTVPRWQVSCGVFDCFSHLLEQYYGNNVFQWSQEILIANMKTLLNCVKSLQKNYLDYDTRANLMWTTSMSLNGISSFNSSGDWNVHGLEHAISAKWDVSHGAGLALITPTYIKIRSSDDKLFKDKTIKLAKELFNVDSVDKFINYLTKFIKTLKLPLKFTDFDNISSVSDKTIHWLVDHAKKYRCTLDKDYLYKIMKKIPV